MSAHTPGPADYERAHYAVMQEADRINARWRSQSRQQRRISDEQFDAEREAEQHGISVAEYLRG
jgi:hypothetical protein